MAEARRTRAANVAIALAIASSVVVAAAIVVTVVRSHARTERSRHPREKREPDATLVRATDVLRLDGSVEAYTDPKGIVGIHVRDRALAAALALHETDVITAIAGRIVRRETDVSAAVNSFFMLDPSALYVDIVRDSKPLLLKWELDGNMRDALADLHGAPHTKVKVTTQGLAAGVVGGIAGVPIAGNSPTIPRIIDPFATPHALTDPLVATLTQLDVDHVAVPASTFHVLFDDPLNAMATGIISTVKRVPIERDGRSVNRLFGIRPSTIWYALGLRNGDIVLGANGRVVGFPSIFDDTRSLATADRIDLEVERSGSSIHLYFDITP